MSTYGRILPLLGPHGNSHARRRSEAARPPTGPRGTALHSACVTLIDALLRLDWARGIAPSQQTRVDLSFDVRF